MSGPLEISRQGDFLTARFKAMASPCELLLQAPPTETLSKLLKRLAQETWRIERKFSRYRDDNIIARINHAQGKAVPIDGETARLLDFASHCWELSQGCFDISSGILRRAWKFDGSDRIPKQFEIDALLPHIGWDQVSWNGRQLQMPAGMEIDLGGIGKEYAVDRVLELLCERCNAPALVNFGGDLRCNAPPHEMPGGELPGWRIGIDTGSDNNTQGISLQQGALATSGDAQRYLLKDGKRYSHVLDARSGWPVEDAPQAVTVAADSCSEAGVLATLALMQGAEAENFLKAQEQPYWISRRTY